MSILSKYMYSLWVLIFTLIIYLVIIIKYIYVVGKPDYHIGSCNRYLFWDKYHGCLYLKSSSATYAYKYNIFIIATIIFPPREKLVT